MSCPNHGYTGAVLPRPSIRSTRPFARCCNTAYSSAMRTGSFVVIRVVAVVTISLLVVAAMNDNRVVGEDEKNGGVWGSPLGETVRTTSLVFFAIRPTASIRTAEPLHRTDEPSPAGCHGDETTSMTCFNPGSRSRACSLKNTFAARW